MGHLAGFAATSLDGKASTSLEVTCGRGHSVPVPGLASPTGHYGQTSHLPMLCILGSPYTKLQNTGVPYGHFHDFLVINTSESSAILSLLFRSSTASL